jgi:hypothetical protein
VNADTGIAYELGEDLIGEKEIGDKLEAAFWTSRIEDLKRPLSADEMAAAVDAAKGDAIVRVDPAAAQRARLGDRELRRRRQRRR